VRGVDVVARKLERVIGFHRAAHVELAAGVQRPAAVRALMGAQIGGYLGFEHGVDLVQEVHHHDVFGGNRCVGFELEQPVARRRLPGDHRVSRERDGSVEQRGNGFGERQRDYVRARLRTGTRRGCGLLGDAAHVPGLPYERRRTGSEPATAAKSSAAR
jgi:hypothetical protein